MEKKMEKKIIAIIFISFCMIACKKEDDTHTVEVVDYVTGQPLEQAELVKAESYDFQLSCLCFMGYRETSFGFTDQLGRKEDIPSFTWLQVRKDNYYIGKKDANCYFELKRNSAKFHLFKKATFEIIPIASQNYPANYAYLNIYPVLRDGTALPFADFIFLEVPSSLFHAHGFGDIQNRLVVLRYNGQTPDTLFKTDFFAPANTNQQITIRY